MAITRLGGANAITGTLPAANINDTSIGNITALPAAIATGKVLQVVTDTLTSEYTTTSTSFSDTGLTLNITPSATSNKILMIAHLGAVYSNTALNHCIFTGLRGSTNLGHTNYGFGFTSVSTDGRILVTDGFTFLDSPSSTSQLTYKVQGRLENATGAGQIAQNGSTATLTCFEIGA